MEKFNRAKLKDFNLNRDSRPSDPENNSDPFKPTDNNFNGEHHSFEREDRHRRETHEGVDDFDGDEFANHSMQDKKPMRASLDAKYRFDAI